MFRKANIFYPLIRTRTCVSKGKKCWLFGKFCVCTKWMIPYTNNDSVKSIGIYLQDDLNILYILLTAGLEIFGNSKKNIGCKADQCKICALQFFLSITWHKWFSIFHVAMQTNHVKAEYENSVKPTAVSRSFKHILKPLKTLKIHTWQTQTP